MIKAILTKPLDGQPEGTEREFSKQDFEALERMGAVKAAAVEEAADESTEEAPAEEPAPEPEPAPARTRRR